MNHSTLASMMFDHTDVRDSRVSKARYVDFLVDWAIHPLRAYGRLVGAVALRGAEIHVVYFGRPKASIRGHLCAHLQLLIDAFGYADTFVEIGNERSYRFCERLGFREVATVGAAKLMRCTELTYARKK